VVVIHEWIEFRYISVRDWPWLQGFHYFVVTAVVFYVPSSSDAVDSDEADQSSQRLPSSSRRKAVGMMYDWPCRC